MLQPGTPTDVVNRLTDSLAAGDLTAALALISAEAVDHSPLPGAAGGLDGWRQKWEAIGAASAGQVRIVAEQRVEHADTVATRYSIRLATTNEPIGFALDMIRVRDGQVIEHWGLPLPTAVST